jgi:drug/metabolite transporter (DMT)-like permease
VGGLPASPSTSRLVLGFGAVYLIWGSTYLAIRIAIESLPPFTMAAARFLTAGAVLYPWARWYGKAPAPTAEHWRNTALLGALLLLAGNGGVVWAEQWVPSGLVALLVGMLPLWMVLVDWLFGSGRRPGPLLIGGLLWGLLGVALLAGSGGFSSKSMMGLIGAAGVMVGNVCWAYGSIRARRVALPSRMALSTAMQMLWGGAFLLLLGALLGELGRIDPAAVSARSLLATAYLTVFGSLIAFSAFSWLNTVVSPARVSTYAYVNPVVALFLGWALAGEPITGRTLLAAFMILSAVVLITRRGR